jgi:HEPN domain-containing protein
MDVDEYKWTALERHLDTVHLKYTDPKAYQGRAAFLPPVQESSTQAKEVMEMASLKVEIAKRKMEVQARELMIFMANEMLEKNCQALGITDPIEKKKLFDRIFKMLKEQNPVDRCVAACCDDDMGSVIMFYRRVFEIYCRKESFRRLLERIENVALEMKKSVAKKARFQDIKSFPTWSMLYRTCEYEDALFHRETRAIVEKRRGRYLPGPIKAKDSCTRKLATKYKNDHTRMVDVVRASGIFAQPSNLLKCLEDLNGKLGRLSIVRISDRMNNPTDMEYRDLKMNVMLPSGLVCELQLHMEGFYKKKEELHKFYEIERVKPKQGEGPELIMMSATEMANASAKLVNAQQEFRDAEKVKIATSNALRAGRKLSAADMVGMQQALLAQQVARMEAAAAELVFDPAAHQSQKAAGTAAMAASVASATCSGIFDFVALCRYMAQYYASLIACRAAAAAAELAAMRVNEVACTFWLDVVNEDLNEERLEMKSNAVNLNKESNVDIERFKQRFKMGLLVKAGMASTFHDDFSALAKEHYDTYIKYISMPLRDNCFRAWRQWVWCQKLIYPKYPPPRPRPPDSDSDTEDEDGSEEFWAEEKVRVAAQGAADSVLQQLEEGKAQAALLIDLYGKRKCRVCREQLHEWVEDAKSKGELVLLEDQLSRLSEECNHDKSVNTPHSPDRLQRKVSLADASSFSHLDLGSGGRRFHS